MYCLLVICQPHIESHWEDLIWWKENLYGESYLRDLCPQTWNQAPGHILPRIFMSHDLQSLRGAESIYLQLWGSSDSFSSSVVKHSCCLEIMNSGIRRDQIKWPRQGKSLIKVKAHAWGQSSLPLTIRDHKFYFLEVELLLRPRQDPFLLSSI